MFLTKQAEQIFFVTIKSTNDNSSFLFRVNNYYTIKKLDFSLSHVFVRDRETFTIAFVAAGLHHYWLEFVRVI